MSTLKAQLVNRGPGKSPAIIITATDPTTYEGEAAFGLLKELEKATTVKVIESGSFGDTGGRHLSQRSIMIATEE
jgi:hypothetical protein